MQVEQLEAISIPIGQKVEVDIRGKEGAKKEQVRGEGIACNRRHFTVRDDVCSESFLKVDLISGQIGLREIGYQALGVAADA